MNIFNGNSCDELLEGGGEEGGGGNGGPMATPQENAISLLCINRRNAQKFPPLYVKGVCEGWERWTAS